MIIKQNTLEDRNLMIDRYCQSIVLSHGITSRKNPKIDNRTDSEKRQDHANIILDKNLTNEKIKNIKKLGENPCVNGTVVAFPPHYIRDIRLGQTVHQIKKTHKRKSFRTVKKLKQLINLFYEYRDKQKKLYWVTITTLQHRTKKTDAELFYAIKLWLQHRGISYICVAERQRDNGFSEEKQLCNDLHFHLIIQQETDFSIGVERKRLSDLFGVDDHPARFDVKRIFNVKRLVTYIAKYVQKSCPSAERLQRQWDQQNDVNPKTGKAYGYKPPYSSIFFCRTFSCSQSVSDLFKGKYPAFRLSMPVRLISEYYHLFKEKYRTAFYTVYEWNIEAWALAQRFKQDVLKTIYEKKVPRTCILAN